MPEVSNTFSLRLAEAGPAALRSARHRAAAVLGQWGLRPGAADDACLVVSELVTNAFLHGRSEAVLTIVQRDAVLRVEVRDEDTRLPVIVAPDPESLSGRGLALVSSLATLWGAERSDSGKCVWAEFDVSDRRSR